MTDIRLKDFNEKTTPIADDILYGADSSDSFKEIKFSITQMITAYSPGLVSIAELSTSANQMLYTTGADTYTTSVLTPYARTLLEALNASEAQVTLGLTPSGGIFQPISAALTSIANLTTIPNQMLFTTASNSYSVIAPAADSVLATSNVSVPAMTQRLPSVVQNNITALGAQSQTLNMNTHLISNVSNPVSAQDVATKNYVTSLTGNYLPLTGGTLAGVINMDSHKITNLTDPTSPQDAATKAYSDALLASYLLLTGGTMSGLLNMGSHQITNVTDPTNAQDAATMAYVDAQTGNFLPILGGSMQGAINMGNHKITNVTNPTLNQDAVTLNYLNTEVANYLPLSGGTLTGAINMGSHKLTSVTDPTNPQDAATKAYVDLVATGFNVQAACYAATTGNLTASYSNGASGIGATLTNSGALAAFTTDGTAPTANARILVCEQSSSLQNGIYSLTNQGSGAVAWILTRVADYDQPSEITAGDLIVINNGTLYNGTSFVETASVSSVGVDPILFSQFTFSATDVLLKANNLGDVANTTTSFNNISPLSTKGDLIGYSSQNVRLAVGSTNGQLLQVDSTAAAGLAWSTASYPKTTTANQLLYSSSSNTVTQLPTIAGGVLVTDSGSVPQMLVNPGVAGKVLQSANGAIPTWSTPTYPNASGTSGAALISDGTNYIASASLWPNTVGTSGKILISNGTSNIYSTPTFPTAAGTSGNVITSDGTNFISSPPTGGSSGGLSAINFLLMGA